MAEPSPADVTWVVELALARGWTTAAQVAAARAAVAAGRASGLLPALAPLLRPDHKEALRRELVERTSERPTIPLGKALSEDDPGSTRADPGLRNEDDEDTGRLPQQATWPEPATTRAEGAPGDSEDGRPTSRLGSPTAAEPGATRADARDAAPAPAPTGAGGWRPGAQVGELVLRERLGEGGMGAVFRAEGPGGVHRAVKVLAPGAEASLVERFRREGVAQAATDGHPNVARVFGTGEAHGRRYLVLELIEGGDLDRRLSRDGPWSSDRAARLGATLAGALAHCHSKGILHRDLKPSNVMFGADGTPKLVDFGIARVDKAQALTRTGVMMGTPAYGAPEQVGGEKGAVDERSDVYGLGAILFTVLTGAPPFEGDGLPALVRNVLMTPAAPPSSRAPGVDPELDALVVRALAKEPAARPPSAAAMAASLEAIALRLERGGPSPVRRRRSRRLPLAFGAAFAGGLGLVGLALALRPARDEAVDPAAVAAIPTTTLTLRLLDDRAGMNVAGLSTLVVTVEGPIARALRVRLDGEDVAPVATSPTTFGLPALRVGRHTLEATVGLPGGGEVAAVGTVRAWPPAPAGLRLLEVDRDRDQAVYVHERTHLRLRWVEPATFVMGKAAEQVALFEDPEKLLQAGSNAINSEGDANRLRPHRVTITRGFFMGESEVTREAYDAWRTANRLPGPDRVAPAAEGKSDDLRGLPVSGVTWDSARAFCADAGLMLPTEAEWELAARGTDGRLTPWSEAGLLPGERPLNYEFAFQGEARNLFGVVASDRFPRGVSPSGCAHLAGNVWEWVEDTYAPYPDEPLVDPLVSEGVGRVTRGGSFRSDLGKCTAVWREFADPEVADLTIGFRVCWSPRERPTPGPTRPVPKPPEEERKKRR